MTIVFVHIPKAGGNSFRLFAESNYSIPGREVVSLHEQPPSLKALHSLSREQVSEVKFAYGHFPYGSWEGASGLPGPHRYVTFLRDPVERVLSLYSYLRQESMKGLRFYQWYYDFCHRYALQEILNVEFLAQLGEPGQLLYRHFDNGQTRLLSGSDGEAVWTPCTSGGVVWPAGGLPVSDEHLAKARGNISEFAFVGRTETLSADWGTISRVFGWRSCPPGISNPTDGRIHREDIDQFTLERIFEWNKFDVSLYNFVITSGCQPSLREP
jgi:hypothetical protein